MICKHIKGTVLLGAQYNKIARTLPLQNLSAQISRYLIEPAVPWVIHGLILVFSLSLMCLHILQFPTPLWKGVSLNLNHTPPSLGTTLYRRGFHILFTLLVSGCLIPEKIIFTYLCYLPACGVCILVGWGCLLVPSLDWSLIPYPHRAIWPGEPCSSRAAVQ